MSDRQRNLKDALLAEVLGDLQKTIDQVNELKKSLPKTIGDAEKSFINSAESIRSEMIKLYNDSIKNIKLSTDNLQKTVNELQRPYMKIFSQARYFILLLILAVVISAAIATIITVYILH